MTSLAFMSVLDEIEQMHDRKQADYGRPEDPFANVRSSEDFGVPPWVGALVRANDKMKRLQKAAGGGVLTNEGIEDSLLDLATYVCIALVLWRQEQGYVDGFEVCGDFACTPVCEECEPSDLDELMATGYVEPNWDFSSASSIHTDVNHPSYRLYNANVPQGTAYIFPPSSTFTWDGLIIDELLLAGLLGQ